MPIAKFTNKREEEIKQSTEKMEKISYDFIGTKDEILRTYTKLNEVNKEIDLFRKQMIEQSFEIKREVSNFKANKFASSRKYLVLKESKDILLNIVFVFLLILLSRVDSIQKIEKIRWILYTVLILIICRIALNIISLFYISKIEDEEE